MTRKAGCVRCKQRGCFLRDLSLKARISASHFRDLQPFMALLLRNHLKYTLIWSRQKHKYPKNVRDRLDYSKVPQLDFEGKDQRDVVEKLVRGGGPGGQSVATTSNNVQLTHLPTGVAVKCHQTRSLEQNRKLARIKLVEALDNHLNGEDSVDAQALRIQAELTLLNQASDKKKRDQGILDRLKEKESKVTEKIDWINSHLSDYSDPQSKIDGLNQDLVKVREKIRKIEDTQDE